MLISSVQNIKVKSARSLHSSKGRWEGSALLVEGVRLIEEAAQSSQSIEQLFYCPERCQSAREQRVLASVEGQGAELLAVTPQVLQALSQTVTPQGLVARVTLPLRVPVVELSSGSHLLVADGVQDPGNMGTLMRLAHAFACCTMVVLPHTVDYRSDKVVRASMGAVFHLPVQEWHSDELVTAMAELHIPLLVLSVAQGIPLWHSHLAEGWAFVVGNEGRGVSPLLAEVADQAIMIPMPGGAESLNVATAAAIALYEATRQQARL